LDTKRKNFYNSESKHTPEYRQESQRFKELLEEEDEKKKNEEVALGGYEDDMDYRNSKKPRRLFDDKSGRAFNVNEAQIDFNYNDHDPNYLTVELELWKHLDSSYIEDLNVEPTYLSVRIKGKIFQLRFLEEVYCSDKRYKKRKRTSFEYFL
jgi:protein TilB